METPFNFTFVAAAGLPVEPPAVAVPDEAPEPVDWPAILGRKNWVETPAQGRERRRLQRIEQRRREQESDDGS